MLASCGFNFLGFPLYLDYHKEDCTEIEAAKIIQELPRNVYPVLITYLNKATDIVDLSDRLQVSIVQIHGEISLEELEKIKRYSPGMDIIKSLVVSDDNFQELTDIIRQTEKFIDAFITDTFNPKTGAKGATGLTHDWNISKKLKEMTSKPLIMAGGLNPDNLEQAIKYVGPAGVDVHTGIEDKDGTKSEIKSKLFAEIAKKHLTF